MFTGPWKVKLTCGVGSSKHSNPKSASTSVAHDCSSNVKRLMYGTCEAHVAVAAAGSAVTVLVLVLVLNLVTVAVMVEAGGVTVETGAVTVLLVVYVTTVVFWGGQGVLQRADLLQPVGQAVAPMVHPAGETLQILLTSWAVATAANSAVTASVRAWNILRVGSLWVRRRYSHVNACSSRVYVFFLIAR